MDLKYLSNNQVLLPGIYGGMGPLSHIKFEEYLVKYSRELDQGGDQNLPVWLLISGSSTPDRTLSIEKRGPDAMGHLLKFCKVLETNNCDFIVLVCNTAHKYLEALKLSITIPFISLIDETVQHITQNYNRKTTRVGLLATDGTLKSEIYQKSLQSIGFNCLYPKIESPIQVGVMDAIYNKKYGIKYTGNTISPLAKRKLHEAQKFLVKKGAEVIITGCTEISLAFEDSKISVPLVDPLKISANKIVKLSLGIDALKTVQDRNFPEKESQLSQFLFE